MDYRVKKVISLLFNTVSRFIIAYNEVSPVHTHVSLTAFSSVHCQGSG